MFSHFFIDRPIFAMVISIVVTLTGAIALVTLPIAQYPPITPPSVQVSINYPGASAQIVTDTVAAPIEQQVNGVPGMLYMSSQMGNDGSYSLSVTFDVETDLDTALVMVQNRVMLAMPLLPTQVQSQGITIRKRTPDILMIVSFFSGDGRYDDLYLSNFATINVRDELLRLEGVADVILFGQRDYSIRVWLDPQKMASYSLNAGDVARAIRGENIDLLAGQIGQAPASPKQAFETPVDAMDRLATPEEFGDIIVKVDQGIPLAPLPTPPTPFQVSHGLPVPGRTDTLQGVTAIGRVPSLTTALGGLNATTAVAANTLTMLSPMVGATPGGALTGGGATLSGGPITGTLIGGGTLGGGPLGGGVVGGGAAGPGTIGNAILSGGESVAGTPSSGVSNVSIGGTADAVTTGELAGLSINTDVSGSTLPSGATTGAAGGAIPRMTAVGIVRLRDVGRVEMGAQNYRQASTFDGHPSVGAAVFQLPGTNALEIAERVRQKMEELKRRFPEGVDYTIAYDTTPFIRESIAEVFWTLFEAALLVGAVVLLFLQNWRSVLIPMLAVPVAIVGTFAVMTAVGFSLNNISLFGLVLAIGIVVDDAIVVVENVERWLERGLAPRDAARHAMEEVTSPVIAVALVLCAVFVPCAFVGGIPGRFFRQFAVTIAASTVFSAINSLTLSPALAALLLRPRERGKADPLTRLLDAALGPFFRAFNAAFAASVAGYGWVVGRLVRASVVVLLAYGVLLVLTYQVFEKAPRGFVPQQDQGRIIGSIQLPDSASLQRTRDAIRQIDEIARGTKGVAHTFTVAGYSFVQSANGSNFGSMFIVLAPFEERKTPDMTDEAIMGRLRAAWARQVKDAKVLVFGAPPIPGLSVAGGFKLMVEDRGGLGLATLQQQTDALIRKLRKLPELADVATQFRSFTPQLFMDIDRTKVATLDLPLEDVNQTLQIYLGSLYVDNFNAFGRHWQVNVQADGRFRNHVKDVGLMEIRNTQGQMVPLSTLVNVHEIGGPIFVNRYNLYTAASITGTVLGGRSSGDVIAAVDKRADETLSISMNKEWTELMFMQIRAGNTAFYVFLLAAVCAFLALAALYESWSLPLAVILVVPLCLLCSVTGVRLAHNSVNIFVQIGLVVLVGLACKNSILIVEFAKRLRGEGRCREEAAEEASRLRLRPILMTSFAFILGVVPLVVAGGAGAEMRRSLGTAVFGGMLGVTLFGIFLTPVFFHIISGTSETRLFTAAAGQWIGALLLGTGIGLLVGFSLAKIGVVHGLPIAVPGAVGAIIAAVLQAIRRRVGEDESRREHRSDANSGDKGDPSP